MQVVKRGKYLKHRWYVRWFCQFLRLWMSSSEVARLMNISKPTIHRWAPSKDRKAEKKRKKAMPLLGTMHDAAVGRQVGLSKTCIRNLRLQRNIPPYVPPLSARAKTVRERDLILRKAAENQVNQDLMNAWKAP